MFTRPVWAEISRQNLIENYRQLRALAGADADLLAVVKANAYGHGILECAPLLVAAGADWIGVTCVEEGIRVRAVCPDVRILVMSGVWRGEAEAALEHGLTAVAWEPFHLDLLEAAAARTGLAPAGVPIHLEIDTGMSRQGVRFVHPDVDQAGLRAMLTRFHDGSTLRGSPLRLEGLMTHFSAPEALDEATTGEQVGRFATALGIVQSDGFRPRWVSAGNSATVLTELEIQRLKLLADGAGGCLLLRPGLALYGYPPQFSTGNEAAVGLKPVPLKPVLAWKTRVASLRTIQAGDGAGYNATFRASRPTRVALLPCGYADGISRLLSNRGQVLIRGERAPIVGRVSMDQTIADVTGISGVEIGDEVALIGAQGGATITAYDIADLTGTIPYEVLCGINLRVPRVLVE